MVPLSVRNVQCCIILIAVNVALNKKAWRHPDDMPGYEAKLATDGKTAFDMASMSCTQSSAGTDPWFLVDLEKPVHVFQVKVLNTDTNRKCKSLFLIFQRRKDNLLINNTALISLMMVHS
jgi:hypothetical protein